MPRRGAPNTSFWPPMIAMPNASQCKYEVSGFFFGWHYPALPAFRSCVTSRYQAPTALKASLLADSNPWPG